MWERDEFHEFLHEFLHKQQEWKAWTIVVPLQMYKNLNFKWKGSNLHLATFLI